jgi:FkbM family methyltransferase
MSIPGRSFLFRHKLISTLRDWDIRGIRRLSVVLPKLLLPSPEKVGKHQLTTIHGVALVIDPSVDKGVELSLFQTGTYEKGTIQLLTDLLKSGSTFLDIGANIGLLSAIASKRVGPEGKVIAVEANPKTVDILRHNLALNDCTNTDIYPFALGAENGTALLYENWEVNRGGASLLSQGDAEGIEVPVRRLDELLTDEVIDVLKIDVEGFELEVLKGGIELLKNQLPVLIIEVSEQRENEKGVSPQEIYAFVQTLGNYQFFKQKGTKERRSKLVPILGEADLPKHDNIVCIPLKRQ